MNKLFTRPALVCNCQSGSFDDAMRDEIVEMCRAQDSPIVTIFNLPDDALPDDDVLRAQDIDVLIVWTGDGTINAAAQNVRGWDGAILPLPGGTLNLLSKQLHGERPLRAILADVVAAKARRRSIPIVHSVHGDALITVVAGPATRWAEVRETMRQEGIVEASRDAPDALDEMLNAPGVRVAGHDAQFPAVILTPTESGLRAEAILTEGAADVLRHGIAWLGGDFRKGPSEEIARGETIILESAEPISVEFDGELAEVASPARFAIAMSAVDFVVTQ